MASQRKKDAPSKVTIGTSPIATKAKKNSSAGAAAATTNNPISDKKQVPNYLKPTICSSGLVDHPNPPPRKHGIFSIKPNINRRRSFDKPPSSSSSVIQKSPHAGLRSPSPVLAKVNSLPKTHIKNILQPTSIVRANMPVKKINTVISTTHEEERNDKQSEQGAAEVGSWKKENEVFSVSEIKEEVKSIEINNNELDESEVAIVGNENPSSCEDIKLCELEVNKDYVVDIEIEGVGEKAVVGKLVTKNHDEKKEDENDMEKEGLNKDAKKVDEKEKEKEKEKQKDEDEDEDEDIIEIAKKDALESNNDVVKIRENSEIVLKDVELKGDINEEAKDKNGEQGNNEAANASDKEAQQQVHYNDVIEETKNKLLKKRKNQVKALVGAFETVISLQEPEP